VDLQQDGHCSGVPGGRDHVHHSVAVHVHQRQRRQRSSRRQQPGSLEPHGRRATAHRTCPNAVIAAVVRGVRWSLSEPSEGRERIVGGSHHVQKPVTINVAEQHRKGSAGVRAANGHVGVAASTICASHKWDSRPLVTWVLVVGVFEEDHRLLCEARGEDDVQVAVLVDIRNSDEARPILTSQPPIIVATSATLQCK
jgi:hypothetical protein